MKNQQADPENLLGCDIANERKVGIGKSIWDFIRIIGLVSVLAYMVVILAVWMRFDSFTAGEPNLAIKYTEWFLGGIGIVALFEIVFKQMATIPKRYFKHFGIFAMSLTIIVVGTTINAEATISDVALNLTYVDVGDWQFVNNLGYATDGDLTTAISGQVIYYPPTNIHNYGYVRLNLPILNNVTSWNMSYGATKGSCLAYTITFLYYNGTASRTVFSDVVYGTTAQNWNNISINDVVSYVEQDFRCINSGSSPQIANVYYYQSSLYSNDSLNPLVLVSPSNTSVVPFSYPPQTTDVTFSWSAPNSTTTDYNLIVARDINFNLVVSDTTFFGTNKTLSLDNDTYYWKVRPYYTDSATYGAYTLPWEVTTAISGSTEFGTAIRGTVFEALNGIITPISGATVTLYNNSLSSTQTQITGSNGYYLFTGLSNSTTYNIKASRQDIYTDSQTYYLTTGLGTTLTQDIQLQRCVSGFNCFYNQHYVKFVVQNWYGATKYSGVATTVYKGTDVAPMTVQCTQLNCVTGTDGAVDILLVKDQQYRITFVDASQGISQTFTVTPFEERYYIIVSTSTGNNWWGTNNTYSEVGSIIVSVSTSSTATTGWVNVTYQDNLAQTTGLIIYLNQTNKTLATSPQIVIQSNNSGAYSNSSKNFSISSYAGNSYIVNVEAKHTTFGSVVRSFGVHFEGLKSTAADFIPSSLKAILAMGFMIFIGAIFGESRRAQGAGIMVVLGWIFLGAGFFAYFGSARIGAGLVMATIVVVMWHFNERRSAEGMQ